MGRLQRWQDAVRLMGPAFLVSVAYLDPGNWATAIEGGSRFGYKLVWVVVLSNLIAILLQTLAARLGLVTGKHLALLCRQEYPRLVCILLWVLCEVSIVALDLTMVIGTAVGLNLLFRLPLLPCILLSGLDSLFLLLMVPSLGLRKGELLTVGLILVVVCCFLWDLILSNPPLTELVSGLWPSLTRDSLYTAVCLLGANVMPHNFYLHSALVSGQANQIGRAGCTVADLCRFNQMDITVALGVALLINVAVMCVAAATFHSAGITVRTLQDAHDVMEQLLSSSVAPKVFGMALLCAGQLSTFTGTISGQVVLKGFMNISLKPWMRRLLTRSAAIVPAAVLQVYYGSAAIYQMLLIAQVVLALQLPFTLVPLIKITSSRSHMGAFANSRSVQAAAWGSTLLIFAANLLLCMELVWPHSVEAPPQGLAPGVAIWSLQLLSGTEELLAGQTLLVALAYILFVVAAATGLSLLLWMIVTPLKDESALIDLSVPKLASKAFEWLGDKRGALTFPQHPDHNHSSSDLEEDQEGGGVNVLGLLGSGSRGQGLHSAGGPGAGAGPQQLSGRGPNQQKPHPPVLEAITVGEWWEHEPSREQEQVPEAPKVPDSWEELELIDIVTDSTLGCTSAAALAAAVPQPRPRGFRVGEGMGQGARRQCAAVLNDFWAALYDLHGQPFGLPPGQWQRVPAEQAPQEQEAAAAKFDEEQRRVAGCLEDICTQGGAILLCIHCQSSDRDAHVLLPFEAYVTSLCPASGTSGVLGGREGAGEARVPQLSFLCVEDRRQQEAHPAAPLAPVASFGVWCILRLLQLLYEEPRPELWGRFAGVLNRLQGVVLWLMPAEPRADRELAAALVDYVVAAEGRIQARLGVAGTAAGEAAFPKGKEIALSVLKRYRRLLTRGTGSPVAGAAEAPAVGVVTSRVVRQGISRM